MSFHLTRTAAMVAMALPTGVLPTVSLASRGMASMRSRLTRVGFKRGSAPGRIAYVAVSRNEEILAEAVDGSSAMDNAPFKLGRRMVTRAPPPGWDDIRSGKHRAIRLPIHDIEGCTSYTISFGIGFPLERAQAFVQKLALMIEPLIEKRANFSTDSESIESTIYPVLERELDHGNSGENVYQIENQIHEVKSTMLCNVEMMLDRSEKISDLESKSSQMEQATLLFKRKSRRLRRFHLSNQVKWGVAIGTMATAATAAVTIPIVVALAA